MFFKRVVELNIDKSKSCDITQLEKLLEIK